MRSARPEPFPELQVHRTETAVRRSCAGARHAHLYVKPPAAVSCEHCLSAAPAATAQAEALGSAEVCAGRRSRGAHCRDTASARGHLMPKHTQGLLQRARPHATREAVTA